jgi:hypothetical protein
MSKKHFVTFSCSNAISVYHEKSGVKPRLPYKSHGTEQDAINYLKEEKGIDNPKIVYHE